MSPRALCPDAVRIVTGGGSVGVAAAAAPAPASTAPAEIAVATESRHRTRLNQVWRVNLRNVVALSVVLSY